MNHFIFEQLSKNYEVKCVDKINPPYSAMDRITSKAARLMRIPGVFPAFTEERLTQIADLVHKGIDRNAALTFFHGATPWLNVDVGTPYAIYLDACFGTYIDVYHNRRHFNQKQLASLYQKEKKFLSAATAVFFSSAWAMNDTRSRYEMSGENFHVAGLGGGIHLNGQRPSPYEKYFLFASLDFFGKGGDKVVAAFNTVHRKYPEFCLKIVGEKPPTRFLSNTNIHYEGLVNKNTQEGYLKLSRLFSNAYCFVLPTSRDMTPLVLVEAATVGCPAITTSQFGIPEIVIDGKTGILVHSNDNALGDELTKAMEEIAKSEALRQKLSEQAFEHAATNLNWNKVGEMIATVLENCASIKPAYA